MKLAESGPPLEVVSSMMYNLPTRFPVDSRASGAGLGSNLGDLYAESRQTLQCSFSVVLKPKFASKYSLEGSRLYLHNALFCIVLHRSLISKISLKIS